MQNEIDSSFKIPLLREHKSAQKLLSGLFLLSLTAISTAGTLAGAPVVFRSGEWSVLRTVDQMTDETDCTGIYKGDYSVQLTDDTLYIKVRGGVKGVNLRFGDQPVEGIRLATESERDIGSVVIKGKEFTKLVGSTRLRMQVVTILRSSADFDFDLTGMAAAVENIRAKCPGTSVESKAAEASACGDKVIARLREKGVAQDVIGFACAAK